MDSSFFVFNDTATTEIYTLSLHDALPISPTTHSTRPCGWSPRERVTTFDRSTNGAPASAGKEPAKAGAPLRSLAFDRSLCHDSAGAGRRAAARRGSISRRPASRIRRIAARSALRSHLAIDRGAAIG